MRLKAKILKYGWLIFLGWSCANVLAHTPGFEYQLVEKNNQEIHLVSIDLNKYKIMSVRADNEQSKEAVSDLVKKFNANIGINGGFFYFTAEGKARPTGVLKINDQWFGYAKVPKDAIGWNNTNNEVLVDKILTKKNKEDIIEIFPQLDTSSDAKRTWQEFPYIVGGIPLLIKNSKNAFNRYGYRKISKSFIEQRHARTAICVKDNQHWVLLVAAHTKEADRPYAHKVVEGLTIEELSRILLEMGCSQAINLDGGGSSTLVIDNKVINSSAGDMDDIFHFYHERPVTDAILVIPR
ncbi:MAG: phosphodiester glycosidase family protein [Proteobacteria bacterium]|nr:phosphodiester glycosidase family protein [Pseudomonadota bacterium]